MCPPAKACFRQGKGEINETPYYRCGGNHGRDNHDCDVPAGRPCAVPEEQEHLEEVIPEPRPETFLESIDEPRFLVAQFFTITIFGVYLASMSHSSAA